MGRYGITEKDVKNAVEYLKKKNINPTIDNIRIHLGKGSKTTIKKHRDNLFKFTKEILIKENSRLMEMIDCIVSVLKKIDSRMDDISKKLS